MEDLIPNSPQVGLHSYTIGLPDGNATLGVPTGQYSGIAAEGSGLVTCLPAPRTESYDIFPWLGFPLDQRQ